MLGKSNYLRYKKNKNFSVIFNDELVKYGYVKKDWQFSGMAITPKKSNTLGE